MGCVWWVWVYSLDDGGDRLTENPGDAVPLRALAPWRPGPCLIPGCVLRSPSSLSRGQLLFHRFPGVASGPASRFVGEGCPGHCPESLRPRHPTHLSSGREARSPVSPSSFPWSGRDSPRRFIRFVSIGVVNSIYPLYPLFLGYGKCVVPLVTLVHTQESG